MVRGMAKIIWEDKKPAKNPRKKPVLAAKTVYFTREWPKSKILGPAILRIASIIYRTFFSIKDHHAPLLCT